VANIPNWCSCELHITGTKEELQKFKEFSITVKKYEDVDDTEALDTEKYVPFPDKYYEVQTIRKKMETITGKDRANQEMLQVLEDNENPFEPYDNQLDWCCANWGTKWGICHSELFEETDKKLTYTFDTAWSPCYQIIFAMSKKFPTLKFVYKFYEGGMGFSGKYVVKDGKVIEDKYNNNYRGGRGG